MMERRIEIKVESDVVAARQAGRDMARELGFGSADQTRLATAISELTRYVIEYASKGVCVVTDEPDQNTIRIRVEVEDHGPGIPDIEKAMEYGVSADRDGGGGLPGAKRLVQEFDIESQPGQTKVTIAMVRQRP